MTATHQAIRFDAHDAGTTAVVGDLLSAYEGRPVSVVHLDRRPSLYRTSAVLDELDVTLDDGRHLPLVMKETSRHGLTASARRVRPAFVHDSRREVAVYRSVLAPAALGTCAFYGTSVDHRGRTWCFLERVAAAQLSEVGDLRTWMRVADWLGRAHALFRRSGVVDRAAQLFVLRYDADYWQLWLARAQRVLADDPRTRWAMRLVARHHDAVVSQLSRLPMTLVHGEFYPSNVLAASETDGGRICPIDWEMSGVGPGLLDVAALVTGWPECEQDQMALAYQRAWEECGGTPSGGVELQYSLACCRLQMAVHWLGWFGRHEPPAEHARDWLDEATGIIGRHFG